MIFELDNKFEHVFVVSEDVHAGFITLFEDKNSLHVSDQFAVQHGFQRKVMHGNILSGFVSYFVGECLPDERVIIHKQNMIFKKPVYLNDQLSFEAVVTGIFNAFRTVEFGFSFKNADREIVAKGSIQIGLLI